MHLSYQSFSFSFSFSKQMKSGVTFCIAEFNVSTAIIFNNQYFKITVVAIITTISGQSSSL